MFQLISDAACDFTAKQAKDKGVDIIPFYIIQENGMQKTSQPNPQDYIEKFIPHLKNGTDLLVLTISSKMSGSYNSAVLAADILKAEYPKREIVIIDSLSASVGQGLILEEIVNMRDNGYTLRKTAKLAADVIKSTRVYFTVENLDHLRRGGRISVTKAFVGGVLGLRPVLHIVGGSVVPLATVRGKKNIYNTIGKASASDIKNERDNYEYRLGHVENQNETTALNKTLEDDWGIRVLTPAVDVGLVISTHTGPGALAFAYCKNYKACEAVGVEHAA